LLHTADVHLGISQDEERAFTGVIDEALRRDVSAILIAGDLFDHRRVSDDLLAWTAKELDRAERPVVLLTGNHDVYDEDSIHHRFRATTRCPRVALLDDPMGSLIEIEDTDIIVWGRAMEEHARSFRPFEGLPARPSDRWAVAAGHGLVRTRERPSHHASPISPADLDSTAGWDYVALGHHHAPKIVRDVPYPAIYPGMTIRATAEQAGAVLVTFDENARPTTSFEWVNV
jgi:DNA repair protein SbcD/Mre11